MVESEIATGKEQTLLIPTDKTVLVFHRLSTGQRGKGQRWNVVSNMVDLPTSPVTRTPVAVIITGRDSEMASLGNVTSLSTKLLATTSTPADFDMPHYGMVAHLLQKLGEGDNSLNKYLQDGRRVNPVLLKPITETVAEPVLEPAFIPVVAPTAEVQTEPTPNNVVSITSRAPIEMAKVPDKKWADTYINRTINKVLDYELLDNAKAQNENVLIRGHAGSGKTMCILAWASSRGYKYYNVSANVGLEPSHLFGMWIPTEQAGVFRWQDGPVTTLVREGGVLLLNEIDFMPERITTVLFGLLDDRREIQLLENGGEVIKAHPDLVVIGDHNPNYRGSRPMNQAWKDRFQHKWEFEYDKAIEKKLIPSPALLEVANKLRNNADKGELDTPISTRSLVAFCKNVKNVSLDYAIDCYVNGFLDDEREGVKVVMQTAKFGIGADFGVKVETSSKQADEAQN